LIVVVTLTSTAQEIKPHVHLFWTHAHTDIYRLL